MIDLYSFIHYYLQTAIFSYAELFRSLVHCLIQSHLAIFLLSSLISPYCFEIRSIYSFTSSASSIANFLSWLVWKEMFDRESSRGNAVSYVILKF